MNPWFLSDSESQQLKQWLDQLPDELELTLPTLHGLVCGAVVLPIEPNEAIWQSLLLHDNELEDIAWKSELWTLLDEWHGRISRLLQSGEPFALPIPLTLEALYGTDEESDDDGDDDSSDADEESFSEVEQWCIGYIEALVAGDRFDPKLAERVDEIVEMSIPAAFIAGALEGTEWEEAYTQDHIVVDILDALPEMVVEMFLMLRVEVVVEGSNDEPH